VGDRRPTACPNHVALRFGSETADAVEWWRPQSGLTTLTGGCGCDSEGRTRSMDIEGTGMEGKEGKEGQ
jgi:hypothetical protein